MRKIRKTKVNYLSYPKPPVLDMRWENHNVNVVEWTNIPKFPLLLSEDWEKTLRLMECLTPSVSFDVFMDSYFTSFRLLTHLGVNDIRAKRVLNKNRLRKCNISCKKRNLATLKSAHQAKKQCNFGSGLERQYRNLHSFF